MKKLFLVFAIMVASVVGALAQGDRIGTRQWKLVQLDGVPVQASSRAYFELDARQTRFTGNSGCNRMFGNVSLQGRRVDFSNIGTTRAACVDPRIRPVETGFVRALENADRFRQIGNSLELLDRNRVVARLSAASKQDPIDDDVRVGLEDRKWMLEAIKGVPIAKAGRGAFLVFDATKGSAGGNSSCNVFGGQYTANNRTIRITDVVATMRACIEDSRMSVEREYLDALRQANRYSIERNKLMLYRNERLLLTFNGERK
jgi:heat shock protein HslJ